MRALVLFIALPAVAVVVASCEMSLPSAPRVTAAFVAAARAETAEAPTLEAGRNVFLNRCISCHALPDVRHYDSSRIPRFVGWMSDRAKLTPKQKEAVIKYLLAVKATAPGHRDFPEPSR